MSHERLYWTAVGIYLVGCGVLIIVAARALA